jgi:hypothetical protein
VAEAENIDQLITEQEGDTDLVRHLRKVIREKNSELTTTRSQLVTTTKESAFKGLGIDTSKGTGKLLFERYDGEATPEKVTEFAKEYGVDITPPAPGASSTPAPGEQQQPHPDAAAARAIDGATQDPSPGTGEVDPAEEAKKAFNNTMASTGNLEMAQAAFFEASLAASIAAAKKPVKD